MISYLIGIALMITANFSGSIPIAISGAAFLLCGEIGEITKAIREAKG